MLHNIVVEGLFGLFNYTISFDQEKHVTILTGPNGYGKTTLLRMLHAVSTKDILFFYKLIFDKIEFRLDNFEKVTICKEGTRLKIESRSNQNNTWSNEDILKRFKEIAEKSSVIRQIDDTQWFDRRTGSNFSLEELPFKIMEEYPEEVENISFFNNIPNIGNIYLIREQRLLKKISEVKEYDPPHWVQSDGRIYRDQSRRGNEGYIETIEQYASDLENLILKALRKYSEIAQQLDSSFPQRLFDETEEISEADFTRRFEAIKKNQRALKQYDILSITEETHPSYRADNARALNVYLNDTEKKLHAFDELIQRLNLFTSILNERRFTFKKIKISKDSGFVFETSKNEVLELKDLSSGEKQEVILLYELLFMIKPESIVLIDEPEISLHVAWQKEFLNDLQSIATLQNFRAIVATHSPHIVNSNWDLSIDLEEISNA